MPTVSLSKLLTKDGTQPLPESYRVQREYKAKFGRAVPTYLFQDVRKPTSKIVEQIRAAIDNNDPFPIEEIEGMTVIGDQVFDKPPKTAK